MCLGSLLGCSNPMSKFNIIPKGKWFKFLVSNHSVLWPVVVVVVVGCYGSCLGCSCCGCCIVVVVVDVMDGCCGCCLGCSCCGCCGCDGGLGSSVINQLSRKLNPLS